MLIDQPHEPSSADWLERQSRGWWREYRWAAVAVLSTIAIETSYLLAVRLLGFALDFTLQPSSAALHIKLQLIFNWLLNGPWWLPIMQTLIAMGVGGASFLAWTMVKMIAPPQELVLALSERDRRAYINSVRILFLKWFGMVFVIPGILLTLSELPGIYLRLVRIPTIFIPAAVHLLVALILVQCGTLIVSIPLKRRK